MIKPAFIEKENEKRIIKMNEMKPYDIGTIGEGEIVIRTPSSSFEVMSLSDVCGSRYWDDSCEFDVTLLPPGYRVVLEVK